MNKRIQDAVPNLEINEIPLERVQNFNFLGLLLNENMSWKPHIDLLANRLAKCAGVLNKLKRVLPIHILRTLYFSMVQSRMMYCILTWGFDYYRIEKLQKRFLRIISSNKYNAHSEPLFKVLDILKIESLFSQSCLKFLYKFKNVNYLNIFYPSNAFQGPVSTIMIPGVLVISIPFIPVLTWHLNALDSNFHYW